jgi:hypothetical protein
VGGDGHDGIGNPWQDSLDRPGSLDRARSYDQPGWPSRVERPAGRAESRAERGVAGNARLTAANAAILLVLLAIEGVTVLRVRQLLSPHVFIGMVLIPPVLLKAGSTTWRFVQYYRGAPAYRRKGPPPILLRLLGPVVIVLTLVLLASGVGLLLAGRSWLPLLLKVHKASFVLWFGAMTVHVLGHLGEVFRLAPRDWLRRTRRDVTGAGLRQWLIAGSLVAGVLLGFLLLSRVGPWLASGPNAAR